MYSVGSFEDSWGNCLKPNDTITNHVHSDGSAYFFDDFRDDAINSDWWYVANGVKSSTPLNVGTSDCSPEYPEGVVLPEAYNSKGRSWSRICNSGETFVSYEQL